MGIPFATASPTTSSSGGGTGTVRGTGSHLFQIDGYSIAKRIPTGSGLKSCHRWILFLYPNGAVEDDGFMSVFPVPYEVFTGFVKLQFELSFIDEVEKQDPAHVRTKQVIDLLSSNYGVDYPRFIALEAFEKSKHLKEDRFTIRCDVLVTERPAAQRCAGCNLRSPSLAVEPAPHACFCDVCHDASRDDPSANHCAGCHGPFTAIILAVTRLPYGHLELD
ncbi:hypothetical protein D1007_31328 [Hordeum vulgare]|nr:hypothetical protein D1007_31328 [Hordeum vulgare]